MTPVIDAARTEQLWNGLTAEQIVSLSGCHYDRGSAVFGVWAPGQKITLNIAGQKFVLPQKEGFSLLALRNVEAGLLYYYSFPARDFMPDIYSYYQPRGMNGASQVIDQTAYQWRTRKNGRQEPVSITKLHIGTATPEGTFAALRQELDANKYFAAADALEFLPLGCFPGRCNWGYDGGPNFPVSVSENYGTPDELKSLIDAARLRGSKIGFDIQLNHYGPEGVWQAYYYPAYLAADRTEWGSKPNLQDALARRFLLGKLREFCLLYQPDFLRLDMSSRYGDDEFIREICRLLPDVAVILEDERADPPREALAQWSFPAVHNLQAFRAGNFAPLTDFLTKILPDRQKVIFADSHDEQGNNLAAPLGDRLTPALAALAAGIEMSWYARGYFHFFCDYTDDLPLVRVTAEKCGALRHYPAALWPQMTALREFFQEYAQAQEFFAFLHRLWRSEPDRAQIWLDNNPRLPAICRAYNQTIFALAKKQTVPAEYWDFIIGLKKLRKENPWLRGGGIAYSLEQDRLTVRNIEPQTQKEIKMTCVLGDDKSVIIPA